MSARPFAVVGRLAVPSAFIAAEPGRVGQALPLPGDRVAQSGKLQAQRLQFERRLRFCGPEVATLNSSLELTPGSSSKEKRTVTRAITVATRCPARHARKEVAQGSLSSLAALPRRRGFGGAARENSDYLVNGAARTRAAGRAAGPDCGPCATRQDPMSARPFAVKKPLTTPLTWRSSCARWEDASAEITVRTATEVLWPAGSHGQFVFGIDRGCAIEEKTHGHESTDRGYTLW
jgi:hypothetical protein